MISHSLNETHAAARALIEHTMSVPEEATVVLLTGDLGAGKTSFVQGMAQALGVTQHITSPTFVLEKVYALTNQKFSQLVHIDAYRLEGTPADRQLNLKERFSEPRSLVVIEWPEHLSLDQLPAKVVRVELAHHGGDTREIKIQF